MRTATPVNFTLDLNGRSGPRSGQVAHALIDAIARGQVHDGDRLPSTRTLAATFGLARTAVVAAYEEGVQVLRPVGLPVEITRRQEGAQMVWRYVGFTARLDRIGESADPYPPAEEAP